MKIGDCLQLALIILKLCGVIKWGWFWVLLPYELLIFLWVLYRVFGHK